MMLEARAAAVNIPEAAETAAEEGMDINMEEVRQGGATRQQDDNESMVFLEYIELILELFCLEL